MNHVFHPHGIPRAYEGRVLIGVSGNMLREGLAFARGDDLLGGSGGPGTV